MFDQDDFNEGFMEAAPRCILAGFYLQLKSCSLARRPAINTYTQEETRFLTHTHSFKLIFTAGLNQVQIN